MQGAAEVAQCLDGTIEAGVLTLLRAAGPHPVGRERERVHAFCQRSPDDVGQCLGHAEHTASLGRGQSRLRGVSDGGGNALMAAVVECYDAAVAERQLYLALTLLAGNLAGHGAVYLVREPVLAGHGLKL